MFIEFTKYQGTGNDFILVDNRTGTYDSLTRAEIAKICDRRFGVGADGLITLNTNPNYDFEMKNYNSDGGECSMCGNGARSLVQFAYDLGIRPSRYHFLAIDGVHEAIIKGPLIELKMADVHQIKETPVGSVLNTGSPHLVCKKENLMTFPVVEEGRKLRNSPMFMPSGINVNFIEEYGDQLFIRTYERGVEDETLSCGTGVIAAALVSGIHKIETRGGTLSVNFEQVAAGCFKNIWLIGPAQKTFSGTITL